MRISQKLIVAFSLVVLLVAAVGAVCLHQLRKVAVPLNKDIPETARAIRETSHLDGLAQLIRYYDEVLTQSARNYVFTQDKKWERRYRDVEPRLDKTIKDAVAGGDEEDKGFFSSIDEANLALVEMEYEAIELVNDAQAEKAINILESDEYWDQKRVYEQGLRDYVHRKGARYDEALEASTSEIELASSQTRNLIRASTLLFLIFVIIALTLSIVLGLAIFNSISRPLTALKAAAAKVGAGELGTRIEVTSKDEIGDLALSFNKMAEGLENTTTSVENLQRAEGDLRETVRRLGQLNKQLTETTARANDLAARAEAASASKGQFLANMSHEIRTPMNAIMGFGDVLMGEELTDEQQSWVRTIHNSGEHLLCVIDDILDFSKIEAHKLEIEMLDCSIEQVLEAVESMVHAKALEKGLKFEIREGDNVPVKIHTDADRLRQCLINLANNAVKFTETGHVFVNVSFEHRDGQPYIRFDVEDTGIGIAPEEQEKIFASFTQADESTTRKYGGTGLGLAITKELTKLLGGELTLTSEKGKGSVFSLVIPVGLDITEQPCLNRYNLAAYADSGEKSAGQGKFSGHVLVVEDVPANQVLIKLLLQQMGLEVTIAADGNEAVQEALGREFDLILMDIQMPRMNGYEATMVLRGKGLTTPIIALTAHAMKGDDEKCFEAGCDDYLTKPIDRRKLLEKLRKHLPVGNITVG